MKNPKQKITLPEQFLPIWKKAKKLLKQGRPDDYQHALEVAKYILNYKTGEGEEKLDYAILIPVALMHDIGHCTILPEDFRFVTGPEKLVNGKLAHMLTGAKIAKEILEAVHYDQELSKEIVDMIRVHDADQLKDVDLNKFYDTKNKKLFHDIDCLDRYTELRIQEMSAMFPDRDKLFMLLKKGLDGFFYPEFKKIATDRMTTLENTYQKQTSTA
jgi:hypothetical protein